MTLPAILASSSAPASYTGNHTIDLVAGIALVVIALRGGLSAVRIALSWASAKARGETHEWRQLRQAPADIRRLQDALSELKGLAQSTNERAEQLERRGNGHLADVVHHIDAKLDEHHAAIATRLGKVEADTGEARRVAGEAATLAANNEERLRAIRTSVNTLSGEISDLRTRIFDHIDRVSDQAIEALTRAHALETSLREVIDIPAWDAADGDG